jgi:alpha-tubulin suppressor-like RCC1 family protein
LERDLIAEFISGPYKSRVISSTESLQYINMLIVICLSLISSSQNSSVSKSPSVSGVLSGGENLRLKQVSCGCDFTVAQESAPAGKIWAWGNNSQAQVCEVISVQGTD